MLDEAFQQQTDAALADMVARPAAPKKQEPAFSLWGMLRGGAKGMPAGAAEGIASTAEVLGAFGQVSAATDPRSGGMFSLPTETEKREQDKQSRAMVEDGLDYRSEAGRSFRNVAQDYMPDPATAHGAEVATAEFFRMGSKAITAGIALGPIPGAIVSGAEEGFTTAEKLAQQGVDLNTRTKVGAVTGAMNAFSFALPVAGSTWKATAGLALTGGPITFMAQQEATRRILDGADYKDLASQYDPFDPVGLTLSTLVPAVFGGMAMRGVARARAREEVEAARVLLQTEHLDATNPSQPTDIAGANLHRTAVSRAIDQIADGQRVDVTDSVPPAAAEHIANVMEQRLQSIRTADPMRDRPGIVPRDTTLSPQDRAIESRLSARVTDDFEKAAADYARLQDSMGGKVLNVDIARELSPDYLADRTKSAAVHEPSSYFIKRLYEEKLAEINDGDTVLFTSGGTGAGKTTGIMNVPSARTMMEDAAIVYDTNMNKLSSAVNKIEQALEAGAQVQIIHVQRDPVDALVQGALPRAMNQAQKYGTGRTVPLAAHADTHRGSAEVIQQLAEHYKEDPRVLIQVVDNTRGKGNSRLANLDFVRKFDYNEVERKLYDALKQQYDAGAIPESVYRATAGNADSGAGPVLHPNVRGQPEPQRDGSGPGTSTTTKARQSQEVAPKGADGLPVESEPLARAAGELEHNSPDLMVQLDGMDSPVPLGQLMNQLREEVAQDLAEAPLLQVAANCFIRS